MKQLTKNSNKRTKLIIIILCALFAAALLYGAAAYGYKFWPFTPNETENATTTDKSDTGDKKSSSPQPTPDTPSADQPSDTPTPSGNQSVVTPPAETPSTSAAFPVENAHYRIEKTGSSNYTITLYAIVNNPGQSDEYTNQLRQYKQEALAYLNKRLGSTDNLTIDWNPPAAKDL